jgi:hypothetical protein
MNVIGSLIVVLGLNFDCSPLNSCVHFLCNLPRSAYLQNYLILNDLRWQATASLPVFRGTQLLRDRAVARSPGRALKFQIRGGGRGVFSRWLKYWREYI